MPPNGHAMRDTFEGDIDTVHANVAQMHLIPSPARLPFRDHHDIVMEFTCGNAYQSISTDSIRSAWMAARAAAWPSMAWSSWRA